MKGGWASLRCESANEAYLELTEEKLMANFMKSEGSVKDWPDFANLL